MADIEIHHYRNDAEEQLNYEQMILNRLKLGLTPENISDEIWEIIFSMVKDGRIKLEVV